MKRILYFVPFLCFLAVMFAFGGPQKFFQKVGGKLTDVSSGNAYGDFIHDRNSLNQLIEGFKAQTGDPVLISELEVKPNEFSAFVQNNEKPETADEIYYQKGEWSKAPLKIVGGDGKLHGKLGDFGGLNIGKITENALIAEKKAAEIGFKDPKISKIRVAYKGNNSFTVEFAVFSLPNMIASMQTDRDGNITEFKKIN
ncbi:MAG TPA: hypothetical protein PKK43_06340 [Spirochaetota bacterium]|nr:hypothetical protein [Spirochaetota bacterium]